MDSFDISTIKHGQFCQNTTYPLLSLLCVFSLSLSRAPTTSSIFPLTVVFIPHPAPPSIANSILCPFQILLILPFLCRLRPPIISSLTVSVLSPHRPPPPILPSPPHYSAVLPPFLVGVCHLVPIIHHQRRQQNLRRRYHFDGDDDNGDQNE